MSVHRRGFWCGVRKTLACDPDELVRVRQELAQRTKEVENLKRRERGMLREMNDVENILAEGLGYDHDQLYGWIIGDHTPASLATQARRRLQEMP